MGLPVLTADCRISIHAPREGSDRKTQSNGQGPAISIHAPREGSDKKPPVFLPVSSNFYPRSPRGERQIPPAFQIALFIFLSTLPARGATSKSSSFWAGILFLSTLPARGATWLGRAINGEVLISIHAPREGSDHGMPPAPPCRATFLSTLPARGATHGAAAAVQQDGQFLSTLPARGATVPGHADLKLKGISIHAPREGSDFDEVKASMDAAADFYPRSPRGERLGTAERQRAIAEISIHAPREGSDKP